MFDGRLWQLIAAGFLNTLLGYLQSVNSIDSRTRLIQEGAFHGRIILDAYTSIGSVVPMEIVNAMFVLIDDSGFAPRITQNPSLPWVKNARVVDGILTADTASEGYTTVVYQWDYVRFNLVGLLSEHSQPGAGIYVLVNQSTNGDLGLPSLYLNI